MTSLGENKLYKNPPPYFIVLASSVKTKEVEVIEFHRIADRVPIEFGVTLTMCVWVVVSCLAPCIFFLTDVMWFTI